MNAPGSPFPDWVDNTRYQTNSNYRRYVEERQNAMTYNNNFEYWESRMVQPALTASTAPRLPARKPVGSPGRPNSITTNNTVAPAPFASDVTNSPAAPRPPVTDISPITETAIQSLRQQNLRQLDGFGQVMAGIHQEIADMILQEPILFLSVRNLVLSKPLAYVAAFLAEFEQMDIEFCPPEPRDDWCDLIRRLASGGVWTTMRTPRENLTADHLMLAGVAETMLLNPALKTKAQRLSMEVAPGAPTNKSFFATTPITFPYDEERYQKDCEYRYWIGERALGVTTTATFEDWRHELGVRFENRKMILQPFVVGPSDDSFWAVWNNNLSKMVMNHHRQLRHIRNETLPPQQSGWVKEPGLIGPNIQQGSSVILPKLPEMQTGVSGDAAPGGTLYFPETWRFPMARNWSTWEEIIHYPLTLPPLDAKMFRRPPTSPEILFTDRFGVTMSGVCQTPQCTQQTEHEFYKPRVEYLEGYDHKMASHGITYEDYRAIIAAILKIWSITEMDYKTLRQCRDFFYDVTLNLRARGVPVVIKYKTASSSHQYGNSFISFRHHPIGLKMRGKIGDR